jgi:putative glutathione S-transferase
MPSSPSCPLLAMDRVEDILSKSRYLTGDQLTEADVRLWTTLIRFDPVYVGHFKTNLRRIIDYPNIYGESLYSSSYMLCSCSSCSFSGSCSSCFFLLLLLTSSSSLALTREIYQIAGVKETVNMFHIKHHYYESHTSINPLGVVPNGPELNFDLPHGRDSQFPLVSKTN